MRTLLSFIRSTLGDLQTLWFPEKGHKETYAYAFLVHPRNDADMERRFPFLKAAPQWTRTVIQYFFWPVTVSSITGLQNIETKESISGYVISIPMTASMMLRHRKRAKKQVRRAVRLARNKGAKIVGLGALTSSLTRGGMDLVDIPGIGITTGHAYTGHTVSQALLTHLKALGNPHKKGATLAVVGAAGSIGSISAELLANSGARSLLLVDIPRKLEKVSELATRIAASHEEVAIEVTSDLELLRTCIGVVTATNAPEALIRGDHICDGTIIVDDAQPSDISPELYTRENVLVLEAGAVHTPGITTNFNMGLADRYDNFCCLAEVLILAANKHTHNFIINRATLDDIAHIAEKGRELGFTLARPQNEKGAISSDYVEHVYAKVENRKAVWT